MQLSKHELDEVNKEMLKNGGRGMLMALEEVLKADQHLPPGRSSFLPMEQRAHRRKKRSGSGADDRSGEDDGSFDLSPDPPAGTEQAAEAKGSGGFSGGAQLLAAQPTTGLVKRAEDRNRKMGQAQREYRLKAAEEYRRKRAAMAEEAKRLEAKELELAEERRRQALREQVQHMKSLREHEKNVHLSVTMAKSTFQKQVNEKYKEEVSFKRLLNECVEREKKLAINDLKEKLHRVRQPLMQIPKGAGATGVHAVLPGPSVIKRHQDPGRASLKSVRFTSSTRGLPLGDEEGDEVPTPTREPVAFSKLSKLARKEDSAKGVHLPKVLVKVVSVGGDTDGPTTAPLLSARDGDHSWNGSALFTTRASPSGGKEPKSAGGGGFRVTMPRKHLDHGAIHGEPYRRLHPEPLVDGQRETHRVGERHDGAPVNHHRENDAQENTGPEHATSREDQAQEVDSETEREIAAAEAYARALAEEQKERERRFELQEALKRRGVAAEIINKHDEQLDELARREHARQVNEEKAISIAEAAIAKVKKRERLLASKKNLTGGERRGRERGKVRAGTRSESHSVSPSASRSASRSVSRSVSRSRSLSPAKHHHPDLPAMSPTGHQEAHHGGDDPHHPLSLVWAVPADLSPLPREERIKVKEDLEVAMRDIRESRAANRDLFFPPKRIGVQETGLGGGFHAKPPAEPETEFRGRMRPKSSGQVKRTAVRTKPTSAGDEVTPTSPPPRMMRMYNSPNSPLPAPKSILRKNNLQVEMEKTSELKPQGK